MVPSGVGFGSVGKVVSTCEKRVNETIDSDIKGHCLNWKLTRVKLAQREALGPQQKPIPHGGCSIQPGGKDDPRLAQVGMMPWAESSMACAPR